MKKAFTLIELIVVVVIVCILAAIITPIFIQAKKAADTKKGTVSAPATEKIITDEKGRTFRIKSDGTLEEIIKK